MRRPRIALLWHGDEEARRTAKLEDSRFQAVATALRSAGMEPEAAIYSDSFVDEVREQLRQVDGVLVWVNPIEQGRDRSVLNALLEEVADGGTFVSAHPQTVRKMGTKEVLLSVREMSWGSDTHLYSSLGEMRDQLPKRVAQGPRVLKQIRGNAGNGVWKVELNDADALQLRVRHALRGSSEEMLPFESFLERCAPYFAGEGGVIDQAYQDRLPEGMVRCYLVRDKVAGFGHQAVNALYPAPPGGDPGEAPQPGPRLYHPPNAAPFQAIRTKMEKEWLPGLLQALLLRTEDLPVIWDADLLYGPKTADGDDTYVLCEINVSSVYPFPDSALEPLTEDVLQAVTSGLRRGTR